MNDQQLFDYLFGVGHPILDVSVNVDDKLLSRYNLKPDDAILAGTEHDELIDYCFENHENGDNQLKLIAGGATQNSIRTAQWVFNYFDKRQTYFLGSVGEDRFASMLEEQARKDNVEPLYCKIKLATVDKNNNNLTSGQTIEQNDNQENSEVQSGEVQNNEIRENDQQVEKVKKVDNFDYTKTGVCLAFNTNNGLYRSMVTFLGAAKQLNSSHIDDFMPQITKSSLIYFGGFLLNSSFDAVNKLIAYCNENNKRTALNLSAPYICSTFGNLIRQLIPNLDIIFGNEKEFRELANYFKFKTDDLRRIALSIFDAMPCRNKEQLIIITQNKHAVLCFMRSKRIGLVQNVPKIDFKEIVDTIGGGDAFAGGFLAYYLMNKDIDLCLKCGIYCARQIIKKTGCNFDGIKFNEQDVIDLFNAK